MTRGRRREGERRSLLERAGAQAGEGASLLFAKLDAESARNERGAATLERLAARLRAGAWSRELASLVARAEELERAMTDADSDS